MANKFLIIDGNSLLFRAFYATSYGGPETIMRNKEGIPTNAIFAFSNMIAKLLSSMQDGDAVFVAFDKDSHTFRKEEFASYKANRKPAPEELVPQFPISRDFLDALNVKQYEEHGIEADDIAGSMAMLGEKEGYQVEVYTSDKDYLQLVSEGITVNLLRKGLSDIDRITPSRMQEEFGFAPKQIIDYKGLRGDSSDNLPGIPGVGEKTASKLIAEYGSFDAIIDAAKQGLIKGKVGENIVENEEMGRVCYRLATMKLDAPLPFSPKDCVYAGYDLEKISAFASKYEFRQLLSRLPSSYKRVSASKEKCPETVEVSALPNLKPGMIGVALDVEENAYQDAEILGIAYTDGSSLYYERAADFVNDKALLSLLSDSSILKCVYDGKALEVALSRLGIKVSGIDFDLSLSAYLIDSSLTGVPEQIYASFGVDLGSGGMSLLGDGEVSRRGKMAFYALKLRGEALDKLKEDGSYALYRDIELPLSRVLAKMEIEGFPLNEKELSAIGEGFRKKRDELQKTIYALAGEEFNIASPKQVAVLLYDKLALPGPKNRSTSVDELKRLALDYPIVALILEYRKYAKLVGTYVDGLLPHIKEDGKIHTCFNQALTSTGRLSSSNPNLQNISTRDEESKMIRKAFHYEDPHWKILSLDYSQIELRILAGLSHCQAYIDVFAKGHDVHAETARRIYGIPEGNEVPHDLRRKAKAVNFAIIYGTTPFGLSEQINGSPAEASRIIASFYSSYPEIAAYLEKIVEEVNAQGYVTTMFGRRRYLPDIKDANYVRREAAKRAALNAPIQGSAADLIKVAMLKADQVLKEGNFRSKMVLQIHDELLFAVLDEEEATLLPKLKEAMENAVEFPVKLSVEGSLGATWFDAKD